MATTHFKDYKENKYLILEPANSHGGSSKKIDELVRKINNIKKKDIGLKFQIISNKFLSLPKYKWHSVYQKLYFNEKKWKSIINKVSKKKFDIWLDIFDIYGAKILKKNFSKVFGIKLQSSVLNNYELLSELQKIDFKKKKIIINFAGYDYQNIEILLKKFSIVFKKKPIIQIGFQNYPTEQKFIHVNKINKFKKILKSYEISFADHIGYKDINFLTLPLYAFQLKYNYVEKHICINRKKTKYDYQSAAEPKELFKILSIINNNKKISKKNFKNYHRKDFVSKAEKKYLKSTLLLPIAKKNLLKGSIVSKQDVIYRRTFDTGLNYDLIKNKSEEKYVLKKNIKKFSTFKGNDFIKCKIGIIIAGRMKSSRLKNKAIRKIFNKTSISRCLDSCTKIKSVKKVVLATSNLRSDDIIKSQNFKKNVKIYRGHPEDVIDRYIRAARKYKINVLVRGTADCPYISGEIVDYLVKSHFETGADFTFANNAAPGTSAEIYNLSTLDFIKKNKKDTSLSEYMTWYVMNNKRYFKINEVSLPKNLSRKYRLTLDYEEDLKLFNLLYGKLHEKKQTINLKNIFKIMDKNKNLQNINKHCKLIFKTNKKLISFLNKKTKF